MFQDEVVKCRNCGADFIFSASDQQLFEEQGFESKPIRCKICREAHHNIRSKTGNIDS